jgi:hypothetical protein
VFFLFVEPFWPNVKNLQDLKLQLKAQLCERTFSTTYFMRYRYSKTGFLSIRERITTAYLSCSWVCSHRVVATYFIFELTVKSAMFEVETPCISIERHRCFGGTCRLHFEAQKRNEATCWFHAWRTFRP